MEGGAPKGRRLDGDSGMKKSEGDRLKYAINESTLSTAARSPFPNGEGYETRIPLSPKHSLSCVGKAKRRRLRRQKKRANPASLRSEAPSKGRGLRGYSLLPMEGGAPKGRRLDGDGCDTRTTLSSTQSLPLEGKAKRTGAERPITICGEAATTTLNPEP